MTDPRITDVREAKQPVWVQDLLRQLRDMLAEAERARDLAIGRVPAEGSQLVLRHRSYDFSVQTREWGLGERPVVVAKLDSGAELEVRRSGDCIEVVSHKTLNEHLVVFAGGASNVVRIGLVEGAPR